MALSLELGPIASGQIAAKEEMRAEDLHSIAMKKAPIELATDEVQLKTAQNALEVQTKILEAIHNGQQAPTGAMDSVQTQVDSLRRIADIQLRSGDVAAGTKTMVQASTLEKNQAYIEAQKNKKHAEDMDTIYGQLAGVHDQASWEAAIAQSEQMTGHPTPDFVKDKNGKLKPYSPEFVAQLREGLLSGKDKALVKEREARAKLAVAEEGDAVERKKLIVAQTKLAETREVALRKAGAPAPKAAELQVMTDEIITHYPGYKYDMPSTRKIARPLIEEAIAMKNEQKIPLQQAVTRVFSRADKDGTFAGMVPKGDVKGTLDRPLDMPTKKADGSPSAPIRKNSFYRVTTGKYAGQVWYTEDGKTFTLPSSEKPAGEDDTDEDEEREEAEQEKADNEEAVEP